MTTTKSRRKRSKWATFTDQEDGKKSEKESFPHKKSRKRTTEEVEEAEPQETVASSRWSVTGSQNLVMIIPKKN